MLSHQHTTLQYPPLWTNWDRWVLIQYSQLASSAAIIVIWCTSVTFKLVSVKPFQHLRYYHSNTMWGPQGGNWNTGAGFQQPQPGFDIGGFGMPTGPLIDPNLTYKIVSAFDPSYCIDQNGDSQDGDLILYKYHGGNNQRWRFIPDGQGHYTIINLADNGPITCPNFQDPEPGEQCYVQDYTNANSQKWMVVPGQGPAQGRGFAILLAGRNFCLDVKGSNFYDRSPIITWYHESKPNQTWNIIPA